MSKIELIQGDCLEKMKGIPDGSVDMVLTDPPYGTTACKWDSVIPFDPMWEQLKRITKKNGAIVLFGSQPFTSALVMSNPKMFKYEWVWEKNVPTGMVLANKIPMKYHENILVFYNQQPTYNKQMFCREWKTQKTVDKISRRARPDKHLINTRLQKWKQFDGKLKNPSSVIKFDVVPRATGTLHPTQKPVTLAEYLIKTYTNEGEIILDFTMGSGTTGVACKNLGRDFIGIELDPEYFKIAEKRINESL